MFVEKGLQHGWPPFLVVRAPQDAKVALLDRVFGPKLTFFPILPKGPFWAENPVSKRYFGVLRGSHYRKWWQSVLQTFFYKRKPAISDKKHLQTPKNEGAIEKRPSSVQNGCFSPPIQHGSFSNRINCI